MPALATAGIILLCILSILSTLGLLWLLLTHEVQPQRKRDPRKRDTRPPTDEQPLVILGPGGDYTRTIMPCDRRAGNGEPRRDSAGTSL